MYQDTKKKKKLVGNKNDIHVPKGCFGLGIMRKK